MLKTSVICVGEALVDQIVNKSNADFVNYLGGAPANVACALKKLEVSTTFIGCLGDDEYGDKFIKLFNELSINTDFLQIDKEFPTRVVMVTRDEEGDRTFSGFRNSSNKFFADERLDQLKLKKNMTNLKKLYLGADFIITGTILLSSKKSEEALSFLIKYAENFKIKVVIDLNWRDIFWDNSKTLKNLERHQQIKLIKDFLNNADILKLALEEAILFFGSNHPSTISKSLKKNPFVIITDGSNPIRWFINGFEGETNVVQSSNIIDTTGAGDAFLAGLISKFCQYKVLDNELLIQKCIQFAGLCGLLTCGQAGAIEAQPNYEKVNESFNSFGL